MLRKRTGNHRRSKILTEQEIDGLFPTPPQHENGTITAAEMPFVGRTAVEFIRQEAPDAIIAADRGGRLLGFTAYHSWKKRFPGERIPTRDGSIRFARLTHKKMGPYEFQDVTRRVLTQAGILDPDGELLSGVSGNGSKPKVTFMDEWVFQARTFRRFVDAVGCCGIPPENVSIITMCNRPLDGVRHAVNPAFRSWEISAWKDDAAAIGVDYIDDSLMPTPTRSPIAGQERHAIVAAINRYYEHFDEAVAAGLIGEFTVGETSKMPGASNG
jgi:hypothetical protein